MTENNTNNQENKLFSIWESIKEHKWLLIGFGIINIIIFIFVPWILSKCTWGIDYTQTGQVGDTIGGTVAPIVAIIASILTFLAYIEQLKLNREQMKQFQVQEKQFNEQLEEQKRTSQRQRFESHFFELLKMHTDFLKGITFIPESGFQIEYAGRFAFEEIQSVYLSSIQLLESCFKENITKLAIIKKVYNAIYDENFNSIKHHDLQEYYNINENNHTINKKDFSFKLPVKHKDMGQYFRIFYQIMNYIIAYDPKILSDEEKYQYIKMYRTQLSPQEQEIFLIHSISKWKNQGFVTKWRITKNIRKKTLVEDFKIDLKELYKELGVSAEGRYLGEGIFEGQYIFKFAEDEAKHHTN